MCKKTFLLFSIVYFILNSLLKISVGVHSTCKLGWKVCQLRTECQETDKILRTKNEINVRIKIKIEIARDGPIPIFYDNIL